MLDFRNLNGQPANNGMGTPSVSLNLSKGMSLDLKKGSKNLKRVRIGLGWKANDNRAGANYDLDASAILLNRGRVNDNADVIFYNQQNTGRGVYAEDDNRMGAYVSNPNTDLETIHVDLSQIPYNTDEIRFIVTIHDALVRAQNFGQIKEAYIRVVDEDDNQELCRYQLNERFAFQISCEIASLKRTTTGWEFEAIGQGSEKDLAGLLISYGVT